MRSLLSTSILFSLLCFLGFVSMVFSAIALIGSLLVGPSPEALLQPCCGTVLARLSVGWLLFAAIGISASFVIARIVRSLWRLRGAARRINNLRQVSEASQVSGVNCRVYEDSRPLAFCAGLLRPEIFVSRSAVQEISPDVLRVVMAHERHHQTRRDPLRRALAKALADGFFFLPILGPLGQKYLALSEVRADQAASASADQGRRDVATALLAFPDSGTTAGSTDQTEDRVNSLSGTNPRWFPDRSTFAITLIALATLLSAPVISVELLINVPVGFEALGLHVCLLILTAAPLLLAGATAWTRPSFHFR